MIVVLMVLYSWESLVKIDYDDFTISQSYSNILIMILIGTIPISNSNILMAMGNISNSWIDYLIMNSSVS